MWQQSRPISQSSNDNSSRDQNSNFIRQNLSWSYDCKIELNVTTSSSSSSAAGKFVEIRPFFSALITPTSQAKVAREEVVLSKQAGYCLADEELKFDVGRSTSAGGVANSLTR